MKTILKLFPKFYFANSTRFYRNSIELIKGNKCANASHSYTLVFLNIDTLIFTFDGIIALF